MKKSSLLFSYLALLCALSSWGQAKYEREFRIKKSEFPENAYALIEKEIKEARRVRFYKEIDSVTVSYEAKFKKDRLHYSAEFNTKGELVDIEVLIKPVDIPEEVFGAISAHVARECENFRIRRLQQQYPIRDDRPIGKVIRDAFQNLILPYINYELIISCKADAGRVEYEYLFDAEGTFLSRRKSLPPNYDHILY
jgi:hypothetical protein